MKNATIWNLNVVDKVTLHVRTGDSTVGVVFGIVRNLAVADLLAPSIIDTLFKAIFTAE